MIRAYTISAKKFPANPPIQRRNYQIIKTRYMGYLATIATIVNTRYVVTKTIREFILLI
jgi:hypothetical protein